MFGYVTPRLDQLSEPEQQRYRALYCGLCREIGEISGRSGRLLLSHDMTFLAALLNSLMEPEERAAETRCGLHPLRKRDILRSRATAYAAAMNLFLMDLKCEDQVRDDGSRLGSLERGLLRQAVDRERAKYPAQYAGISEALEALWQEERAEHPDPDRLSNLSGEMLGAAFVPDWVDPFHQPALRGLGEGLGRFVYWMDAWEDLERDRRKGRFNPLLTWEKREDLESFVRDVLEMMIGEATEYFEALPLEKDLELLRNVLYSGVWQRYEAMRQQEEKRRRKP